MQNLRVVSVINMGEYTEKLAVNVLDCGGERRREVMT